MIPKSVNNWLDAHLSESEAKALVGGTRQNWALRRPKIRKASGVEIKPDVWLYHTQRLEQFLAEYEKYRPHSVTRVTQSGQP